jgi:hypothetical protein
VCVDLLLTEFLLRCFEKHRTQLQNLRYFALILVTKAFEPPFSALSFSWKAFLTRKSERAERCGAAALDAGQHDLSQ